MSNATIAAVSTPLGTGGLAVIRISGPDALAVADRCFTAFSGEKLSQFSGYRAAYGKLTDGETVLDDGVALVFKAPHSYTGEDVVEFSCHGGTTVARAVLRTVLQQGAVPAAGGEFTKRAFLNGKMDLTRAESIMSVIGAQNMAALRLSNAAKDGAIAKAVAKIVEKLLQTAASFSAFADYPDEDIPELTPENFGRLLDETRDRLQALLATYDAGKVVREGLSCAIVGKPNVGKSTLMNLLSGNDRSIVTDLPGTTRDVVETTVQLGDLLLHLSDTAGIRDTADTVEQVGVQRAKKCLNDADLVLAVFDGSRALDADDAEILGVLPPERTVVLVNKTDLKTVADLSALQGFDTLELSAKCGSGVAALTEWVAKKADTAALQGDTAVLISERQRACAERALNAVLAAKEAFDCGQTLDAVGVCVDDALSALLELTGERVTEAVTDEVFRRFCVGK